VVGQREPKGRMLGAQQVMWASQHWTGNDLLDRVAARFVTTASYNLDLKEIEKLGLFDLDVPLRGAERGACAFVRALRGVVNRRSNLALTHIR
jgi:hypothetical protein